MALKLLGSLESSGGDLQVLGTIKASTHGDGFVIGSPTTVKFKLGVYGANDLLFKDPSNNVLMTLTSAGKLGIGATSPDTKLHLVDSSDVYITLESTSADTTEEVAVKYSNSATGSNYWWEGLNQSANWSLGYGTSFSGSTTRLLVNTSGNVGIGTTAPLEKLHVAGKINSSNNIVSNSTYTMFTGRSSRTVDDYGGLNKQYFKANLVTPGPNTTGESSAHGIADLRFQLANSAGNTGMSDIMTLRSGGNVGIGTTVPSRKLHVSAGNGDTAAKFENTSSNGTVLHLQTTGDNKSMYFQTDHIYVSSGAMHFGNDTGDLYLRPSASGKVGIGTTTPGYKLDVSGSFGAKDGSSAIAFNEYSDGATIWLDGSNGDFAGGDYFNISAYGTTDLAFGYGASTKITMKSDGKLGVGTTAPSYGLDVNHNAARIGSSAQTTTSLYLTATNTAGAPAVATQIIMQGYEGRAKGTFYTDSGNDGEWFNGIPYNGSHNYWQVGFDETGGQAEYQANAKLTIRDNGNVGIGTNSPAQKLHVAGSQVRLETAAGGYYLHNTSGTFRGAFHDNGTVTSIYADGNGSTPAISIDSGNSTFAGSLSALRAVEVRDSDGSTTLSHGRLMSNGTEGWLSVSNGSNWGFIVRGPANDPRIGAWYGGVLKIEGFHSSDGATGSNAIDFAQFDFGNNHFQMNAATSTFAGSVSIQSDNEERFLIRSNDYTISRIISRGNSGADLDKGLFSLMSSDGTNNNVEKVRIDSAGSSWFNGGAVSFGDNVTITGNLTVDGTTTTLNTTTVEVKDNILQLNTTQGTPNTMTASTSGISVFRGLDTNGNDTITRASLIFDEGDDTWDLTNNLAIAGNLEVQGSVIELLGGFSLQGTNGTYFQRIKTIDSSASDPVDTFSFDVKLGASAPWKSLLVLDQHDDARFSGSATFAGTVNTPQLKVYPSSSSDTAGTATIELGVGSTKYWSLRQAATAEGDLVIDRTYSSANTEAFRIARSTGNATFAGRVSHNGLEPTSGFGIDQIREFPMTFQLTANTWTDTGIDGADLSTGTYAMQVYVSDFEVGGHHYYEYYSATITWYGGSTNSTAVDEIPVHRAGHATNDGDLQFRTQRASGSDSHDLMLQVKHNKSYTGALDNDHGGKIMRFKFRRLM